MSCQRCGLGFSEREAEQSKLLALERRAVAERGYCIGCQMIRRCKGVRRERKAGRAKLEFRAGPVEGAQLRFATED